MTNLNFWVQTYVIDILGLDLLLGGDEGMQFAWSERMLLQVENVSIGP